MGSNGLIFVSGCLTKDSNLWQGPTCGVVPVYTPFVPLAKLSSFATFVVVDATPAGQALQPTVSNAPSVHPNNPNSHQTVTNPHPGPGPTATPVPTAIAGDSTMTTDVNQPGNLPSVLSTDNRSATVTITDVPSVTQNDTPSILSSPAAATVSTSQHPSAAVIAAAVLGSIVGLAVIIIGTRFVMRRRRRQATHGIANALNMPQGILVEDATEEDHPYYQNKPLPRGIQDDGFDRYPPVCYPSSSGSSFTSTSSTVSTAEEKHTFRLDFPL